MKAQPITSEMFFSESEKREKTGLQVQRFFDAGPEVLESVRPELRKKIRVLFMFAHPDDEATHLMSMMLLKHLGYDIRVEWLSNGDGSTNADTKKRESLKVLSNIGIDSFHFMDHSVHELIDGVFRSPEQNRDLLLRQLMKEVRQRIDGSQIVVTNAFEGGHILHDLTNLLVRAVQDEQLLLEVPQYSLKTAPDLLRSLVRAGIGKCLSKKIFYNVGTFREANVESDPIAYGDEEEFLFPSRVMLNNGGVLFKGSQFHHYQSQWEKVFSPFLDSVEFNGTETLELFRVAHPIPSMWSTLMHLEKWLLSKVSGVINPKKIYQVQSALERLRTSVEQDPRDHQ